MDFYSTIYNYYDHIFMLNNSQVDFVKRQVSTTKNILDIGCATGKLANALGKEGFHVNGIDLDEKMISYARKNWSHPKVFFGEGNMLHLENEFGPNRFNAITCFGNTIVHLTDKKLIHDFFENCHKTLTSQGKLLAQILNYQYIVEEKLSSLPLIDNHHISFNRNYEYLESGLINFNTELHIKSTGEKVNNSVQLLPITKSELESILIQTRFKNIEFFGNFAGAPLEDKSLPLVFKAEK